MQSIKKIPLGLALLAGCAAAVAHDDGGWAAIHWHASDFLGLAAIGVLCVGALLIACRPKRAAKKTRP